MDERLWTGIQLFNRQEFFACHEVLEASWTAEAGERRLFLQAFIHLAVGFYHCQRHNPAGAARQLQKGLHKLTAYLPCCEGIDTARLHREALAAGERLEAGAPLSAYPQIHLQVSSGAGSSRALLVRGV
jgi:uncharacterized protein